MRKNIIAFILIISGLILFLYAYVERINEEYAENIFSVESKTFDDTFTRFLQNFDHNIQNIQSNFKEPAQIKDTLFTQNFFLNIFKTNPKVISIGFFQNNYKIGIRKEKNSIIYAIDSTKNLDIVRWQRFENEKFISAWDESFEISINDTQRIKNLVNKKEQIQWFFNENETINKSFLKNKELFYAGYAYQINTVNYVLLFSFSRSALIDDFKNLSKFDDTKLIIENNDGDIWDLSSGNTILNNNDVSIDSLSLNILSHFKKFDDKDTGIFKFKFHNEPFWNSFKRFSINTGLKNYILTIPGSQLILKTNDQRTTYFKWIALFLIISGLLLLFFKKRKKNTNNNYSIAPLKDILQDDENRYLEFKSSSRWDYRQEKYNPELENVIFKTIAAFGNTDGGILLIGVDDDKNILGLEKDFNTLKKPTADYYEIHLRNNLHKLMGVKNVSKNIRIQFEKNKENIIICKIKILAANEPIFIKTKNKNGQIVEKFFVRSGNSSQEINSVIEINDYINTRFNK